MASPSSSSQPNIDSHTFHQSNHKKRRKIGYHHQNLIPWRSQTHQQIYSSNLLQALRRTPPSPAARQVRHTADRLLARASKGRTRWSRAILASPRLKHLKKVKKVATGLKKRKKRLPAVKKKARLLSRLVPGCRKVSFQNLLEEATDYISALEMQVRAMTSLTELLAGGIFT